MDRKETNQMWDLFLFFGNYRGAKERVIDLKKKKTE